MPTWAGRRSSRRTSDRRALLEVAGLAAGYLGERVIDGIDLEVRTGEAVAIVGSNGAGKTTLFRAIAGLLAPMAGRIVLDGHDSLGDDRPGVHGLAVDDAVGP